MTTHHKAQLSIGPMELRRSESAIGGFRKSEPAPSAGEAGEGQFRNSEPEPSEFRESERVAAAMLDAAFKVAGLENKEIAHLCGVGVSAVEKWRKPNSKGSPSYAQLLCLPPAFHLALNRAISNHYGFGRDALLRAIYALGDLAVAVEA